MITIRNPYIDYDKYGHCVACHQNLIIKQVMDGRVEERALPKLDEVQFLLNDGSKMRVCICRDCKATVTEEDYPTLMACVYRAWELEANNRSWTTSQREIYLEQCRSKSIVRLV